MSPILALLTLAVIFVLAKVFRFVPFGLALSADRQTDEKEGTLFYFPVTSGVIIYAGALVVLDSSGNAKPGVTATGLIAVGKSEETVDDSAGTGLKSVNVRKGVFRFANSADADLITKAEIGDMCYIVDDQTVAKTSAINTRSIAGPIEDVDADGVWVRFGPVLAVTGGLLAANNLNEVNAATARGNLGANLVPLHIEVVTLVGTGVYRVVSPVAGTITKIKSVIDGVLTTGDATLTGKIGANAITDGAITITQAGSAAGDVDYCAPSAARTVAENNVISVTVGGSNATATGAKVTILIAT